MGSIEEYKKWRSEVTKKSEKTNPSLPSDAAPSSDAMKADDTKNEKDIKADVSSAISAVVKAGSSLSASEITSGTLSAYESATATRKVYSRWISLLFSVMSLSGALSQLSVALKWLMVLPGLSIVIILKELFGFLFILRPFINIFTGSGDSVVSGPVHSSILSPSWYPSWVPSRLRPTYRGFVFVFGSLSNLRACLSNFLCFYKDVSSPLLGQESEVQKVSNIVILAFDLVVKTKDESSVVNFFLFVNLLKDVIMLCVAHAGHAASSLNFGDFLRDIEDGRVDGRGIILGLEDVYRSTFGESASDKFIGRLLTLIDTCPSGDTKVKSE